MKYVIAAWSEESHGFHLNPRAYLEELPGFQDDLPPGARSFALDPGHYDLGAGNSRCVKDLELARLDLATDKSGRLTLEFGPNPWKHDAGLRIDYSGVRHLGVDYHHSIDWMLADTVLLDEILPADGGGCTHEIALTDAVVTVRCEDFRATWVDGSPP